MILPFLVTFIVILVTYKLVSFLRVLSVKKAVFNQLPMIGPPHWLWGHLNQVGIEQEIKEET